MCDACSAVQPGGVVRFEHAHARGNGGAIYAASTFVQLCLVLMRYDREGFASYQYSYIKVNCCHGKTGPDSKRPQGAVRMGDAMEL